VVVVAVLMSSGNATQHHAWAAARSKLCFAFLKKDLQWKKAKQHFGQFETETSFPDSPWNLNASINW
jgi:hypothetical protein